MKPYYEDDRPGMMRVHIAEWRAAALCEAYTRDHLREIARSRGVSTGYKRKRDLAFYVACAGVVAPGYDKAAER
jgi:hypothetical protein